MPASRSFFISAPGTDQGKTLITAALSDQLRARGRRVAALKPVVSGPPEDTKMLLRAQGLPVTEETIAAISPWRFAEALSPDEAARREGKEIVLPPIVDFCLKSEFPIPNPEIMLIEGAGGVMSPLSEQVTNLDLMMALACPVIVVSASYLGCISPLLTLLEVLHGRGLAVAGVVLTQVQPQALAPSVVMPSLTPHLPPGVPMLTVNHLASRDNLWESVPEITSLVGSA